MKKMKGESIRDILDRPMPPLPPRNPYRLRQVRQENHKDLKSFETAIDKLIQKYDGWIWQTYMTQDSPGFYTFHLITAKPRKKGGKSTKLLTCQNCFHEYRSRGVSFAQPKSCAQCHRAFPDQLISQILQRHGFS